MDPMITNSDDEVRRTKVNKHQVIIFQIIVLPQLFILSLGMIDIFFGIDMAALGMFFALTIGLILIFLLPILFVYYVFRTIRHWRILDKYNQQSFVLMMVAETPILYQSLKTHGVINTNIELPVNPSEILSFLFFLWGTIISLTPYFISLNNNPSK